MTAVLLALEMKRLATSAELHKEPRALAALHCRRTSSSDEMTIASIDSSPLSQYIDRERTCRDDEVGTVKWWWVIMYSTV